MRITLYNIMMISTFCIAALAAAFLLNKYVDESSLAYDDAAGEDPNSASAVQGRAGHPFSDSIGNDRQTLLEIRAQLERNRRGIEAVLNSVRTLRDEIKQLKETNENQEIRRYGDDTFPAPSIGSVDDENIEPTWPLIGGP